MLTLWPRSNAASTGNASSCGTSAIECWNLYCSEIPLNENAPRPESPQSWLVAPCSFDAIASIIHIVFLVIWCTTLLCKASGSLFLPSAFAKKQDMHVSARQQQQQKAYVTSPKARSCFTASIAISAVLCLLNATVGVLGTVLRWLYTSYDPPPLHVEMTTWVLAASWLALTIATNSVRMEKKESVPLLYRAWWVIAFILSLLSLVPNIWSYRESHQLVLEAWLQSASVPVTVVLFAVAIFGRTGISIVTDEAVTEPFLGGRATGEGLPADGGPSPSPSPGVTLFANAGFFSMASVSWLNPVMASGYKNPLDLNSIPLLAPRDRSEYNYQRLKANWESQIERDPTKSPSLVVGLVRAFWRPAALNAVTTSTNAVAGLVGPLLIDDFVEYLAGRRRFAHEGYVLVLAFFLAKMVENFSARFWYLGMQHLGLHVKAAMTAFVYRKGLRLSNQARQGQTTGEIINYVSVDVQRLGDFCWYLPEMVIVPLQVLLSLLILYKVVGVAAISAMLASALVVISNYPLTKLQSSIQDKFMTAKDTRMKALTESLNSMLILKLQAWEIRYLSKIEELRKMEYRYLRGNLFISAAQTFVFWTTPMFVAVATFGTCVILNIPLTAGRILSALATFRVLQEPLSNLPEFISQYVQTRVSINRLEKYVLEEELQEDVVIRTSSAANGEAGAAAAVEIDGGEFKWDPSAERPTLRDVNLHVANGQKVAICGMVGSGKSSLLSSILGEIAKMDGTVKVCGNVAYVAQTAWIQSGKIEENILYGSPMDRHRYEETLRVCSLKKDMEMFAYGDQTVIGERGINMSGGQKQRIQLARAVYKDADIYLLDDPFSAVDAHTGSDLFQLCILDALKKKTVLYVTHQVEFLSAADLILVIRDGKIVQAGKYDDLLKAGTDFNALVNAHNEAIDLVNSHGYKDTGEEVVGSAGAEMHVEDLLQEPVELIRQLSRKESLADVAPEGQMKRQLVEDEERERGNISFAVYWAYLTAVFKGALIPLLIIVQIVFFVLTLGSNYWMAWAAPETDGQPPPVDSTTLIVVYCITAFASSLFVAARAFMAVTVGLLAAQKFFMQMIGAIFRAPMSFFDSTPTGRILSRASSDQSTLDSDIIFTFSGFMWTFIQLVGIIAVMAQITWNVLLVFVPLFVVCVFLQRYYIKSARELQRLMGVLKSPILHHYGESIAGAVTIRAFGQDQRFLKTNLELYDNSMRSIFHNFAAIQWLMFRMELMSAFVFTFSLCYAIAHLGEMDPAITGLAVTYGLTLNGIQSWCIWTWCNLENRAVSVERILQYTRVKSEAPVMISESRPPPEWPQRGTIELENLQVRYNKHSPFVLHGVTCTFAGGEKIGIVGRTGSGKSTLIQTLFRIVEPTGGRIVIDDVNISQIGLHDLRDKLSIIPQDPTLFEGTIRVNLDPLQRHADTEIWEALDKCQLGDIVRAKEGKLDCPVNENGENWSVGQRQLVCLGRALLKRTTILVLDEATASVDTATDGVIQHTIRNEFQSCTVVTVAHRIPTVIDSDRALVLSDGRIAEYDSPLRLLENKKSLFFKLVSEYSSRSKGANAPPI